MTEIESEREMSRTEIADYLREFATQLDTTRGDPARSEAGDNRVTLLVGDDSATIDPPEMVMFEIEVESDGSLVGNEVEQSLEFELSWTVESSPEGDEPELDIV